MGKDGYGRRLVTGTSVGFPVTNSASRNGVSGGKRLGSSSGIVLRELNNKAEDCNPSG